ncbi:MAG: hypothetical protein IJ005_03875 [Bacteroidales bacterium]|nr:hypothetical protein [Bacteroidales bacterium]
MKQDRSNQPDIIGYIAPRCESIALETVEIICASSQLEKLIIEETDPFNWE